MWFYNLHTYLTQLRLAFTFFEVKHGIFRTQEVQGLLGSQYRLYKTLDAVIKCCVRSIHNIDTDNFFYCQPDGVDTPHT